MRQGFSSAFKISVSTALIGSAVLLGGCGQGGLLGGGALGGGPGAWRGGFGGAQTAGLGPGAPQSSTTPNLGRLGAGNWGATGANPPQMGSPGAPPASFSNDVNAVLQKYNCQIVGSDATEPHVQHVLTALQLYKTRQHQLTVDITADDSKLPVAALWESDGNGATIHYWQPEMQHTIDHEMAHDLTLMVDPAGGDRLTQAIQNASCDQATWPSSYAQTNDAEAMAEIVSFLAAIYAKLPIDEQPFESFNPNAEIQNASKGFMSGAVVPQ